MTQKRPPFRPTLSTVISLLVPLLMATSACVTQEAGYQPLISIEEAPTELEPADGPGEQQARLSRLVAEREDWKDVSADIILALQAQELENQERWETAAQKWLTVMQMDAGALASEAFRHWVQNSDKVLGSQTNSEVLARLLLAQTKDGNLSPWLQKQKLLKLEKLSDRIDDLRSREKSRTQDIAWPPDPTSIRDDPFWEKAVQTACNRELPPSWQKWVRQLTSSRRAYWDGLLASCLKNYEAAVNALQSALPQLEEEKKSQALAINAAERLIQAQKALGRREEAAAAYRLQHKILMETNLNPASVGWSRFELVKRQAESGLWVGRNQALLGDYENARIGVQNSIDALNRAYGAIPDLSKAQRVALDEQKADAYHILATRIAFEQKNYTSALAMIQVAQALPEIGGEWKDRLKWGEGWFKYLLGDRPQAISVWSELLDSAGPESGLSAKLNYWIGRSFQELGDTRKAEEYFEVLRKNFKLNFYHVVGVPRLRPQYKWQDDIDLSSARERLKSREEFEALAFMKDREAGRRLLRAELVQAARVQTWIKPLASELYRYVYPRDELIRDVNGSLYVSRLLHMAGQHQQVIGLTTQIADVRKGFWEDYPEQLLIYYPRPYRNSYVRIAGLNYIDSDLPFAITRQESSFQAEAYSPAEAVGLMQLIVPTANRQALRLGLKLDAPIEDLKRPELNISLGTAYLAELGRRYSGEWPKAFAAYNAGEYVVDAWIQRRAASETILWIEGLSFGETSSYAKNVWRNWEVYRILKASL